MHKGFWAEMQDATEPLKERDVVSANRSILLGKVSIQYIKMWVISALCLPAATPLAQDAQTKDQLFRDQELQLDLFGTYSVPQNTIEHLSGDRLQHTGHAGAGLGATS